MILSEKAFQTIDAGVFLTGPARTGSTLWGQILGSLKNTVYLYEPDFLHALMPALQKIPLPIGKFLFESYLFEDKFVNQLTGRCFNFNKNDNSCIFKYLTKNEAMSLLKTKWNKKKAIFVAGKKKLILKITDAPFYLNFIFAAYKNAKVVITYRNPETCIRSLVSKKWFADETLKNLIEIWPSKSWNKIGIPCWVPEKDEKTWLKSNEIERATIYYLFLMQSIKPRKNQIAVSYENLIRKPKNEIERVSNFLGLPLTAKTHEIIKSIKAQDPPISNFSLSIRESLLKKLLPFENFNKFQSLISK